MQEKKSVLVHESTHKIIKDLRSRMQTIRKPTGEEVILAGIDLLMKSLKNKEVGK